MSNRWTIAKRIGFLILCSGVVGFALIWAFLVIVFPIRKPPKEKDVIQNFHAHRAAYERLRDMLLEDKNLLRVADWGVQTTKTIGTSKPPTRDFPLKRYNEYLALLREAGGQIALRVVRSLPRKFASAYLPRVGRETLATSTFVGRMTNLRTKSQAWTNSICCRSPESPFTAT